MNCCSRMVSFLSLCLLLAVLCQAALSDIIEECKLETEVYINGMGSAFVGNVYKELGTAYEETRAQIRTIHFEFHVGHDEAHMIDALHHDHLKEGEHPTIFVATEIKPTHTEDNGLKAIPLIGGAIAITYNLPGVTQQLILSTDNLVDIYTGSIKRWNDERLRSENPGMNLPDKEILPVAFYEMSAETEVMTSALNSFSRDKWQKKYSVFADPEFSNGKCCNSTKWPPNTIRYYGKTIYGVVGHITTYPYTIGYGTLATAFSAGIPYALVRNKMGIVTNPDNYESIQAAMDYHEENVDHTLSDIMHLNDALTPNAYPIASYSYMVINVTTGEGISCCTMLEMLGFMEWIKFSDHTQTIIIDDHMAPLSDLVSKKVAETLKHAIYCNGENLHDAYQQSLLLAQQLTPLQIGLIGLGAVAFLALISGVIFQLYRRKIAKENHRKIWMLDGTGLIVKEQTARKARAASAAGSVKSGVSGHSLATKSFASNSNSMLSSGSYAEYKFSVEFGEYMGQDVFLTSLELKSPEKWSDKTKQDVADLKVGIMHSQLVQFVGVVQYALDDSIYVVTESARKGSLHYVLRNSRFELTSDLLYSMAKHVTEGMLFLQSKKVVHGNLSSTCCYLDGSWSTKICNWADASIMIREGAWQEYVKKTLETSLEDELGLIWMIYLAPEVITMGERLEPDSDNYAMGLLLLEIFTKQVPYAGDLETGEISMNEILDAKKKGASPVMPKLAALPDSIKKIVQKLISYPMGQRPPLSEVKQLLHKEYPSKKGIVEVMMQTVENYMLNLEAQVKERTDELGAANDKLQQLLEAVLPSEIATKLIKGEVIKPEFFECVSVFFSDIHGFGQLCSELNPLDVVGFLNDLWLVFDETLDKFDVYKADTISDVYMVASGVPSRNGMAHCPELCNLALTLMEAIDNYEVKQKRQNSDEPIKLQIRVGINSGPCTAGIVGSKMPQYCLFGDTVNTASRVESTSLAGRIQISEFARSLLATYYVNKYVTEYRGEIEAKGKGAMKLHWLLGKTGGKLREVDSNTTAVSSKL